MEVIGRLEHNIANLATLSDKAGKLLVKMAAKQEEDDRGALMALYASLAPLADKLCQCRSLMAKVQEHFIAQFAKVRPSPSQALAPAAAEDNLREEFLTLKAIDDVVRATHLETTAKAHLIRVEVPRSCLIG